MSSRVTLLGHPAIVACEWLDPKGMLQPFRLYRQGNHNIALLAYNYIDHHNAICLVIALHCNAKSHHDILGDQVMDGAVLVARILFS